MRKFYVLFILSLIPMAGLCQVLPEYTGYKSLACFQQDTVAYLDYNWGARTSGASQNIELRTFFDRFELPIYAAEFSCIRMRKDILAAMWIFTIPLEKVLEYENAGDELEKNCLFIWFQFPRDTAKPELSPLYDDICESIPGLRKEVKTLLPWKKSYEELFGGYLVNDIQYNYVLFKGSK